MNKSTPTLLRAGRGLLLGVVATTVAFTGNLFAGTTTLKLAPITKPAPRNTQVKVTANLTDEKRALPYQFVTLSEFVSSTNKKRDVAFGKTDLAGNVTFTYTVPKDPYQDNVFLSAVFQGSGDPTLVTTLQYPLPLDVWLKTYHTPSISSPIRVPIGR